MRFFATCAKGTEGALRKELVAAGLKHLKGERGGGISILPDRSMTENGSPAGRNSVK